MQSAAGPIVMITVVTQSWRSWAVDRTGQFLPPLQ